MIAEDVVTLAVQCPEALRWLDTSADLFVEHGAIPMDIRQRQTRAVSALLEFGFLTTSKKGEVRLTRRGLRGLIEAHRQGLLPASSD